MWPGMFVIVRITAPFKSGYFLCFSINEHHLKEFNRCLSLSINESFLIHKFSTSGRDSLLKILWFHPILSVWYSTFEFVKFFVKVCKAYCSEFSVVRILQQINSIKSLTKIPRNLCVCLCVTSYPTRHITRYFWLNSTLIINWLSVRTGCLRNLQPEKFTTSNLIAPGIPCTYRSVWGSFFFIFVWS